MKKFITLLLVICMLTALPAAQAAADNFAADTASTASHAAPDVNFSEGSVPALSGLTEGIQPPIHALGLAMWEHDLKYDIHSATFIWTALYYTLSLYGEADERAQLTEEALVLPSEAVHDFAYALFAGVSDLPSLPPDLADYVRYDAVLDSYSLSLGDFALTQLVLDPITIEADGTHTLNGSISSPEDGSLLCSIRAALVENDTMFGFSVLDVSLY